MEWHKFFWKSFKYLIYFLKSAKEVKTLLTFHCFLEIKKLDEIILS